MSPREDGAHDLDHDGESAAMKAFHRTIDEETTPFSLPEGAAPVVCICNVPARLVESLYQAPGYDGPHSYLMYCCSVGKCKFWQRMEGDEEAAAWQAVDDDDQGESWWESKKNVENISGT